jgi:hypothetical protein
VNELEAEREQMSVEERRQAGAWSRVGRRLWSPSPRDEALCKGSEAPYILTVGLAGYGDKRRSE